MPEQLIENLANKKSDIVDDAMTKNNVETV